MEHLWVWKCIVCKVVQYECGTCYANFYLPRPHDCPSEDVERSLQEEFDEGFYDNAICGVVTKNCNCPTCACRHQFMIVRESAAIMRLWDSIEIQ
jgi:hypothetical protein